MKKCDYCEANATVHRFGNQMWLMCEGDPSHQTDLGDYGN